MSQSRSSSESARTESLVLLDACGYASEILATSSATIEIARKALRNLRRRGSYLPGRNHPLRTWWDELFEPPNGN